MLPSNNEPLDEPTLLDTTAASASQFTHAPSGNKQLLWRWGAVLLLLLVGDALWRIGSHWRADRAIAQSLAQRRSDQQQIWRILNGWREHPPSDISAQEWNFRVIELGIWANRLSEAELTDGKMNSADPLLRQNFRHELEHLNQGPVTEHKLTELLEYLKTKVTPPYEVEGGYDLRNMTTPSDHIP